MFQNKTKRCHSAGDIRAGRTAAKRGCGDSYLGAKRCRNLWRSPVVWMEPNDRLEKRATAGVSVFRCTPKSGQSAGVVDLDSVLAPKIHRRSQFRRACCAGKTGVITVFWSGWERGASSSSLLRSGGRRLSSQHPRLRSPLSLTRLVGSVYANWMRGN